MKRKLIASVVLNCILILNLMIALIHYWMLDKNIDDTIEVLILLLKVKYLILKMLNHYTT